MHQKSTAHAKNKNKIDKAHTKLTTNQLKIAELTGFFVCMESIDQDFYFERKVTIQEVNQFE